MTYKLEILTLLGRQFSGEVVHSSVPAEDGFVGVLSHHTNYVTSSPGGRFEIRLPAGEIRRFQVGPGFFRITRNDAFLLTSSVTIESPA